MTIALDTATTSGQASPGISSGTSGFGTNLSWAHNVGTGADRILIVCVTVRNSTSQTVSGVTYAGTALTKTDSAAAAMTSTNGTNVRSELWKLVNPKTGTNNIVVTFDTAVSAAAGVASSWTGVDQTTPLGAYTGATGTSTTPSVAVASASGDVVVDASAVKMAAASSQTAGQTLLIQKQSLANFYSIASQQAAGTGSNVTMSWTITSAAWATGGVALKPSSTVSPPTTTTAETVKISEISIHPLRNGAQGFSTLGTSSAVLENQQAAFEASGSYAKVLRFVVRDDQYTWDDIYTLGSVAPAGRIVISPLPTQQSPEGSLIVTTQDSIYQYPLPRPPEPSTVEYPLLAASSSTRGADPIPIFYPSAWDGGDSLYELQFVRVICKNVVAGTDTVQIMYRWDDTYQWETLNTTQSTGHTVFQLSQNDCIFEIPRGNFGSVLRIAANVNDGASTDPVAPKITGIICWVKELPHRDYPMAPARAALEVS